MRRDTLTTNSILKIISLVLAIILWFFVVSSRRAETVIDVPVKFINVSPSLEVVNSLRRISIRLEGQERLLRKIKEGNVSVVINLSGYREGHVTYHLSNEDIRMPEYFEVKDINPSRIDLVLKSVNGGDG